MKGLGCLDGSQVLQAGRAHGNQLLAQRPLIAHHLVQVVAQISVGQVRWPVATSYNNSSCISTGKPDTWVWTYRPRLEFQLDKKRGPIHHFFGSELSGDLVLEGPMTSLLGVSTVVLVAMSIHH